MWTANKRFSGRPKSPRDTDMFVMADKGNNVANVFRPVGPFYAVGEHWLKTKDKDGNVPKNGFMKMCLNVDPVSGEMRDAEKFPCPYCDVLGDQPRIALYQNAIDRRQQKKKPAQAQKPTPKELKLRKVWDGKTEARFMSGKDSETWTPVVGVRLTSSTADKIAMHLLPQNVRTLKSGEQKAFGPDHPRFGFDLLIKFDKDAKNPGDKYYVQMQGKTKLSEVEGSYLWWDFTKMKPEPYAAAIKEAEGIKKRYVSKADEEGGKKKFRDYDAEDEDRPAPKKRRYEPDEDDEDTIDADSYGGDSDYEESPRKKAKTKPAKKARRPVRDEDEDDEPRRLTKKASKAKKASKPVAKVKKKKSKYSFD